MPDATDAAFLLLLGLSGGLHCAGMCGPLACSYALGAGGRPPWPSHLAYYGGRLLAYGLLGTLLGAAGGALLERLEPGGTLREVGRWAAGSVMAGAGLVVLAGAGMPSWIERLLERVHRPLIAPLRALAFPSAPSGSAGQDAAWRALPLGMVSGVVPCGLMWIAELKAAASGGAVPGLLLMGLFCVATSPSLYLTSRLAGWLAPVRRAGLVRLSGVVILIMALHLVFWHGGGAHVHPGAGAG